jgi:HEAT repeat protein
MMSANAIGGIGPAAAAAVGPLSAACRREGEVTHVLRACAEALGRIGRPAASALPLLRNLTKKPLVRWSAQKAIDRIEGRPDPAN